MDETQDPSRERRWAGLESEGLRMLLEVSQRINAVADPDAVLATIVDSLVSITKADRGFLMLRDEDGNLEFTIARDRNGRPLEEQRFRVSYGVVNEVAERGETRLIDDAASSDLYQARQSIMSLSLRTILCVPLRTPRGIAGVIYVDSNAITRRFTEGDVPFVEAFAAQAAATLERLRLQQAEMEHDRIRRQLDVAAEIQRTFLPGTFPDLEGVRGAVASVPAHAVGGDFYDVFRLPEDRVGLMVGDVAGKGVPGALFGARLLSDLRYEALYHGDVGKTLSAVNGIVVERATRGMFVTLLYLVLDPATGDVEFASAGHLCPLVRGPDGDVRAWEAAPGIPLGVLGESGYSSRRCRLERGHVLLLLSDGVGDALGASGERFGAERIRQVVAAGPGEPEALVRHLCREVTAFTGSRPQVDDLTLLALRLDS